MWIFTPLYRESTLCRYLNSINAFLSHICIGLALQHERLQFLSETWPFMGSAAACIGGVHLLAASHNIRCFGVTFFFYKEWATKLCCRPFTGTLAFESTCDHEKFSLITSTSPSLKDIKWIKYQHFSLNLKSLSKNMQLFGSFLNNCERYLTYKWNISVKLKLKLTEHSTKLMQDGA